MGLKTEGSRSGDFIVEAVESHWQVLWRVMDPCLPLERSLGLWFGGCISVEARWGQESQVVGCSHLREK